MNLTLSVEDEVVERARQVAKQQGTSLNALIRQYIEALAGKRTGAELAAQLRQMWKKGQTGRSGGKGFHREDAYVGRVK